MVQKGNHNVNVSAQPGEAAKIWPPIQWHVRSSTDSSCRQQMQLTGYNRFDNYSTEALPPLAHGCRRSDDTKKDDGINCVTLSCPYFSRSHTLHPSGYVRRSLSWPQSTTQYSGSSRPPARSYLGHKVHVCSRPPA